MLQRLDLRPLPARFADVLPRAELDVETAAAAVTGVVDDVRERGDAAVLDASERFDRVRPASLRVPASALERALRDLDPAVRAALTESARRTRLVAESQRRADVTTEVSPGGFVTERWIPVRRVGLYVPAGQVPLPSSVVMNAVPAQVAGVASLAVVSPPQAGYDGLPHPTILAACALLGITEVYAAGGAQAVAMLAYGTGSCAAVDVITGPGNVYVAAAKRLVRGVVGIDSEAGPTEICVLADETAVPEHVAADLISQAEHDPLAACLLVTTSVELLDAVDVELGKQVPVTPNRSRVEAALAGQSAGVLVASLDDAVTVADAWAAEHLEVITADAPAVAARIRNAGAVFVGPWSPVSLGDYVAGSNHVLPTGGTARFASPLSVQTFLRNQHVVRYDRAALASVGDHVAALAASEDLHAHGFAVSVRLASP